MPAAEAEPTAEGGPPAAKGQPTAAAEEGPTTEEEGPAAEEEEPAAATSSVWYKAKVSKHYSSKATCLIKGNDPRNWIDKICLIDWYSSGDLRISDQELELQLKDMAEQLTKLKDTLAAATQELHVFTH